MDTKTVGMAVSASAIGAALAYLGLTNYNDESGLLNTEEDQIDKTSTQVGNTVDTTVDTTVDNKASKEVDSKDVNSKELAALPVASKDDNSKVDEIILKKK